MKSFSPSKSLTALATASALAVSAIAATPAQAIAPSEGKGSSTAPITQPVDPDFNPNNPQATNEGSLAGSIEAANPGAEWLLKTFPLGSTDPAGSLGKDAPPIAGILAWVGGVLGAVALGAAVAGGYQYAVQQGWIKPL
ncbi:hypothetical protein COJE103337_07585 [Corynebacterium jeikeium]|uniref:hypothetical protein n=1 Tax=Corynebacterium jeikeium TaxID=38289 RepID=UPI0001B7164A|nr:hypothetical protein [Corynebacterium jeikeium]EEW15565.1 hypothetical protein HMPREF0297_2064 [Corynebacterium jeikeium ATCC 43734]OOD31159.1 hypothetical protein BWP03_06205 [Corynebacterium jeikeium]WCZ52609.1 hypothetical protein CJEIK_00305 [Corynebacterium jeikeium]SUY82085.1 Uncharacterised protein [Corynebacterium jeikeium]